MNRKDEEGLIRSITALLNGEPPRTETRGNALVIKFWPGSELPKAIRQAIEWSREYIYAEFEFNGVTIRVNSESDPKGGEQAYHAAQTHMSRSTVKVGNRPTGPTIGPEFRNPLTGEGSR